MNYNHSIHARDSSAPPFQRATIEMVYGAYQVDGRGRPTEDRIVIYKISDTCTLYAVFDGHSGTGVVRLTAEFLPKRIQVALAAAPPGILEEAGAGARLQELLRTVFIEHDKELALQLPKLRDSGTTASIALVTPSRIIVAYLGDSPLFLVDPKTGLIQKEIGKHEPTLVGETERIHKAGGTIEIDEMGTPRVDGALMVSRAFGDFSLKFDPQKPPPMHFDWSKMKITAAPDVLIWERPESSILAIMSDGLVETETTLLKPTAQVAADISKAVREKAYNLPASAELVVKRHVEEFHKVHGASEAYDGDDLSLVLVDIGKRVASAQAAIQARGGGPAPAPAATAAQPPTFTANAALSALVARVKSRKVRMRKNKTAKKHRLIKILGV